MLLRGKFGTFIVVERKWYDFTGISKHRGNRKSYWIVKESNDLDLLKAMGKLTERLVFMNVNIEED
jgi:hypothetical protein